MIEIIDLSFQNLPLSIASHLVESEAGPIILETGPHSTLPALQEALKSRGYQLEDIKHVFLTHIHLDHAGAAWAFARAGATVYMHPFGKKHMVQPDKLYQSAKRIYQDKMEELWGELHPIPEEKIVTISHGQTFHIGGVDIQGWHTPGHAVHHVAFQIGQSLIAGDAAGVKIGKDGLVVPPCPPPDINIEDWMDSIDLMEQLDIDAVYLTHFGKITDIDDHFIQFRKILWDWANWMRPHYEHQTPPKVITPRFVKYVRQQLLDYGVPESNIAVYENSNPSWMSVAGLLRYWKKKLTANQ